MCASFPPLRSSFCFIFNWDTEGLPVSCRSARDVHGCMIRQDESGSLRCVTLQETWRREEKSWGHLHGSLAAAKLSSFAVMAAIISHEILFPEKNFLPRCSPDVSFQQTLRENRCCFKKRSGAAVLHAPLKGLMSNLSSRGFLSILCQEQTTKPEPITKINACRDVKSHQGWENISKRC